MPVAYLPSPANAVWHLGAIPVRAYVLCLLLAVVTGIWLTDRRYRRSGGQQGVIMEVATVAVPIGLIGARLYSVLSNFGGYFGPGRDWTDVFRIWEGGVGVAGAVVAGAFAGWVYCRRVGIEVGPIALAAAPALAVAQAIATWGNWFNQEQYGRPSTLPWAVAIAPGHRTAAYQAFATFQPVFLYESLLDLLVAVAVAYAIRRYSLTGDRAFALYAALYAATRCGTELMRIDYATRIFGVRANFITMIVVLIIACAYLAFAGRRRRRLLAPEESPARPLRPRSTSASASDLDLPAAQAQK